MEWGFAASTFVNRAGELFGLEVSLAGSKAIVIVELEEARFIE